MLHAVGIGYAMRYRKESKVVMTFFGDGATSEGDFHEAMNFASVLGSPVIFMCQNNHWAISVPRSKQSKSETLAQKAIAYAMPGIQVDGNDVLAIFSAAKGAVKWARSGKGPSLIELLTYRMGVHTTADDPKKYRPQEEVEKWEKRDPITRFEKYLTDKGLLDEEKIKGVEEDAKAQIKQAEERWREFADHKIDPLLMFDHLYAEIPPYLARQKEKLARELGAAEVEDKPVRRT
jgi:TPP-dependent pyruvate/acetoin dehydrogenase alpha subunit